MKPESDIERTLGQLGHDWPASASIAESVLRRLDGEMRSPVPYRPTRKRGARALLAAAALFAILGAWFYFGSPDNSLSAQVIKAMDRAKSLDVVTSVHEIGPHGEDRGLTKVTEARFVDGQGFRYDLPDEIRVGNDTSFWRYNRRTKIAFRSASGGVRKLLNDWFDVHKFAGELQSDFERDPAADTVSKNERARAYLLTRTARYADRDLKEGRRRLMVFLDSRSRIVCIEQLERETGEWRPKIVEKWSYDVPVDPKLFEPNFGADVKVVDSDRAFDELADLRQAVHVEDRAGLIYAVHRIERFEGGGLLVMSSVRGDEETLKQFPLARRMIQLGLYHVDGPAINYNAIQGNGYFRFPLARASHQGIDLMWWLQIPRGQPSNFFEVGNDRAWIMAGVMPWGKYAEAHRNAQGAVEDLMWKLPLTVPKRHPLPTLEAVAGSVYADADALADLPSFDLSLDLGIDDTSGQRVGKRGSPADTTPAQFAESVARQVRWWFRQDLEFQIKMATDPTALVKDTVGWSYIPDVGDRELVRLSTLTGLKRLYLAGTAITDRGLASLSGMTQLEQLDLSDTAITDAGLAHLAGLRQLKWLDVKNTRVTDSGVKQLKSLNPHLKVVRNSAGREK